ncbi:short chain dehydrogenase reductase family protein [Stylonychia lemnae]|uniref:Short chain dehydrogenase reductase family protein n=1 Tax=Stylonychia lemnae TaxID=5949 RepID=A0A078B5B2_STYLE|nr:short chain dehydrogenase reductase family protein [Stylonychia lemnae]|eukprot:CDW88728.1 short chain dehydrogenase reductase family protein [Stylonychia lemnae]
MDCCCYFDILAIILGAYVLIPKILEIVEVINHSFMFKQYDIKTRYYGKDSWALITGCTSGIGEEIAHRLGSFGFNLILVSRIADFAKNGETLELYDDIYNKIKDLDLAILVNNAGVNTRNYIKDTPLKDIMEMVIVNTYPYTFLTHKLLSKLKERQSKSAIITISSSITVNPAAFDAIYGCTKIFELFTMEGLRLENKDQKNLDFLIINPAYVSTNNARLHPGSQVETTQTFVDSLFKALGNTQMTFGTPKHCINGFVLKLMSGLTANFNAYHFLSERIISKLANQMWEKRT